MGGTVIGRLARVKIRRFSLRSRAAPLHRAARPFRVMRPLSLKKAKNRCTEQWGNTIHVRKTAEQDMADLRPVTATDGYLATPVL